jgi:hypothetical protein
VYWANAEDWCETNRANLIKIDDNDEYNLLYNFYKTYASGKNLWVG